MPSASPGPSRVVSRPPRALRGPLTRARPARQNRQTLGRRVLRTLAFFLLTFLAARPAAAQKHAAADTVRPTAEIKRLYQAFAGDWDTTEKRERTQLFP